MHKFFNKEQYFIFELLCSTHNVSIYADNGPDVDADDDVYGNCQC